MIVNTARITVEPQNRQEFIQTVKHILQPIKAAKGCRSFNVYVDTDDENSSLLVSEWDTEDDLNNHLKSEDFAILRGVISVLGIRTDELTALVYAGGARANARTPIASAVT
jgi:quinol monooxygenase YgiN